MSDNRVLILGGAGFIGRHVVKYLIDKNLASFIRVVDKRQPQTVYLGNEFSTYFANKIVECKQANLSAPKSVEAAFHCDQGKFNWVINLAAETRFGKEEKEYQQMVHDLSLLCAAEGEKSGCSVYIEVSTAQVYSSGKKASTEKDKTKPWTALAKFKLQAEEDIKAKHPKLPLIIVRPAMVYGKGDMNSLMPRIICAATYTSNNEKYKLLWTEDMKINTVHVDDVAAALIHLCQKGKVGEVYNLADKNDTTQGSFTAFLENIFGIEAGYWGSIMSNLASLKLQEAVDYANESHMGPWLEMLKAANINFTPISPYIDKELLSNNALSVDGSYIESTGFSYSKPTMKQEYLQEEIDYFVDQGIFPKVADRKSVV